jgi:hypothetical protein
MTDRSDFERQIDRIEATGRDTNRAVLVLCAVLLFGALWLILR